ncbi:MAG: metal-dependent transcriptional regulator [Candidatus Latescibacterota bacterium]|jgi:DtxR family Mn-dependent transcriptional regulator
MKTLTANMEMYLKTIFEITGDGGQPRVKTIAQRLGVTMPSVSGAIENLQKKGLVEHTPYGDVKLTSKGRRVARQVKDRNELIYRFLLDVLKLPPATATRDACVLEHVVSPRTLERLSSFLRFTESHSEDVGRVIEQYSNWLKQEETASERVES